MRIFAAIASAFLFFLFCPVSGKAQQGFRLPDLSAMKHLTTTSSDHAADIPGKETTMDFYTTSSGEMITVYSYRGKRVAFSSHMNSDIQGTYRLFMDLSGQGLFQEINRSAQWQLPAWVR